jgi:exodeoxyribonuclease-5
VPLYALQYGDRLAAAAIARVRIDKDGGFKGLAADDDLLPGIKAFPGTGMLSDWAALIPHWQRQLSALAEEVVAGRADPTPGPRTCDYCDLAALCRVALMDATERDEDSQGTGGSDD